VSDRASACAAAIVAVLERYHQATVALSAALEQGRAEGIPGPVDARARCIEEYAAATAAWRSLPEAERDPSAVETFKWHHLRINQAETDVLRLATASMDEASGEIARIGTARKLDRAYQAPDGGPIRILNSEG
jgi:hypothetical protein